MAKAGHDVRLGGSCFEPASFFYGGVADSQVHHGWSYWL